jgi:hypothetical protein
VQSYTLAKLLERAHDEESRVLRSVLEQTSWKSGRRCAEKRWSSLRPDIRRSMRRLVLTLSDTPFGGSPEHSGLLMARATDDEARFDLLRCAHQSSYNEVRLVADELCAFHAHWLKGFAYGLNPAVRVETSRENGRCRNRWTLGDHVSPHAAHEAVLP